MPILYVLIDAQVTAGFNGFFEKKFQDSKQDAISNPFLQPIVFHRKNNHQTSNSMGTMNGSV